MSFVSGVLNSGQDKVLAAGAALLLGCVNIGACSPTAQPTFGEWGVETNHISATVGPGEDFYTFVNEGWIANAEIPPDRSYLSQPWVAQLKIYDDLDVMFADILSAPRADAGNAERRIQDLHRSFMDVPQVSRVGLLPIKEGLDAIAAIETHEDVARFMADPMASTIFQLIVKPPENMLGGYVLSLEQYRVTGLGLPGQAYYKSSEQPFIGHRAAYREFASELLALAQINSHDAHAVRLVELESRFANVMWDFAQLRDASAAFDLISIGELSERAPGFPWQTFFDAQGLSGIERINFGIGGLSESSKLFRETSIDHWKSYLYFHWIANHAELLPENFGVRWHEFYRERLSDGESRASRSQKAIELVQDELGWDVGSLYVERHFPKESSNDVLEIAEYVRRAFKLQLQETDWMDDETRAEALEKADAIIFEMAKPKVRVDLSQVETRPDDLIGNVRRIRLMQRDHAWQRLGKPISRWGDWNMYPHRVGLGFHQQYNKIFITAGALLPPFYDPNADAAVNFGSIGSTIGHEFGHSLDDQGSKFDSRGALRDWWSDPSREEYDRRTQLLIEQFAQYELLPGTALKSEQMIGEIVGDLTGALIARRAYDLYLQDHPEESGKVLGGFTGPQRYWLGLAQKTRMVAQDSALREMSLFWAQPAPPHSVNGVVANLTAWYRDFDIQPDQPLFRTEADRNALWTRGQCMERFARCETTERSDRGM